jgi:Zn-dependent peptidase ImmA (M78 family)
VAKNIVQRVDRNLARRLREARRETGLSSRSVSAKLPKRLAISHSTLASYENGSSVPPVDVLAALADVYGRTINWFLENRDSLDGFRYRNIKSRVPITEQRHFEAMANKWADAYMKLDKYLETQTSPRRKAFNEVGAQSPEQLADSVRKKILGLDDDQPIQNVVRVLEMFSAWALELRASFGLDGAAARFGADAIVVLNPDVSNDRIRMNAAHELAHVLYFESKQSLGWTDSAIEKKAYDFATSLLLPTTQLHDAFAEKSFLKLIQYKERFGISLAAMIHMAERSEIINTSVSRWLWKEMTQRGWKLDEPGYVWKDRAITFETILDVAIQTKRISWADAERITGIREDELRQRVLSVTYKTQNSPVIVQTANAADPATVKFQPLKIAFSDEPENPVKEA